MTLLYLSESILLGMGLAMDAFSVSLANGLTEPKMKFSRAASMASVYAIFQGVMPLIGWFLIHYFLHFFRAFSPWIPWIALLLLLFIGSKMLYDGLKTQPECICVKRIGFVSLILQGLATSIDALSVGFTFAEVDFLHAIVRVLLIALVTFLICLVGIYIGKKFGTKLSHKACILGGVILILIGIEIFITSFF